MEIRSRSEKETYELGQRIGSLAWPGMIILVDGDLGTGKTVLTKGIAKGLGIEEVVTSPTFTLIHEYQGRLPLYHFDLYRLEDADEIYDLGFEEFFYGQGLTVVEWPWRMGDSCPQQYLKISIEKAPEYGEDTRLIRLNSIGEYYKKAFVL